ncbi:hypothetical protein EZS27_031697, partial [termite gut metagenome]
MNEDFRVSDSMPIAALSVKQFRELFVINSPNEPEKRNILNKEECSELTGYSVYTINKLICDKQIPYYKNRSKVFFQRNEIEDWMLSNRVETTKE